MTSTNWGKLYAELERGPEHYDWLERAFPVEADHFKYVVARDFADQVYESSVAFRRDKKAYAEVFERLNSISPHDYAQWYAYRYGLTAVENMAWGTTLNEEDWARVVDCLFEATRVYRFEKAPKEPLDADANVRLLAEDRFATDQCRLQLAIVLQKEIELLRQDGNDARAEMLGQVADHWALIINDDWKQQPLI